MTSVNLSDQARERLREELEVLRTQRGAVTDGLDEVDTAGDRMDGAETLRRHDEVAMLDDRITELTRLLAGGHAPGEQAANELTPGTRVTVRQPDGSVETLRAVAITEEIAPGEEDTALTVDSPLGKALAGHGAGDTVGVETPDGTRRMDVIDIEPPE
ncbi:MAG: GreA/GreB family elongation factor [Pseudonocardiales bacterium]|nr:GreA/GreB family elongation factor [Pseudonocardiales bacterium]